MEIALASSIVDAPTPTARERAIAHPGQRFVLYGAEFDVVHVHNGQVRYASVAGGTQHRMSLQDFDGYAENGVLTRSESSPPAPATSEHSSVATMTESECRNTFRIKRYVDAALQQLKYPRSLARLKPVVEAVAQSIQDEKAPSPRSVARWVRVHKLGESIAAIGRRRSGNCTNRFDDVVECALQESLTANAVAERRDAMAVRSFMIGKLAERHELMLNGAPRLLPSLRTINRRLQAADQFERDAKRYGRAEAQRRSRAAGRSFVTSGAMFTVMFDSHRMDVVVRGEDGEVIGRPWLYAALDVHTRAIVGYHIAISSPSASNTLQVFKAMLNRERDGLPGGVPSEITPDHGTEFENRPVQRLCRKLYIKVNPAQTEDPNGKAPLESFFRSFTRGFSHTLPGTTFSNTTERGSYDSVRNSCLTLAQVREHAAAWIDGQYNSVHTHTTTKRVPALYFRELTQDLPPSLLTAEDIDALARTPMEATVNHGRIRVLKHQWFSHALTSFDGSKVMVHIDTNDLGHIFVQHPDQPGTLIRADSVNPSYARGLSLDEHREAQHLLDELSANERRSLGEHAEELSRYMLMERVLEDCEYAKKRIRLIRKLHDKEAQTASQKPTSRKPRRVADAPDEPSIPELIQGAMVTPDAGSRPESTSMTVIDLAIL